MLTRPPAWSPCAMRVKDSDQTLKSEGASCHNHPTNCGHIKDLNLCDHILVKHRYEPPANVLAGKKTYIVIKEKANHQSNMGSAPQKF